MGAVSLRHGWFVGFVVALFFAIPSVSIAALEPDAIIGAGYYPAGVNDNGQVAVDSYSSGPPSSASIWNPDGSGSGTFMPLQPLYAGGKTDVTAMNASGQSVGTSATDASGDTAPTLWSTTGAPTNIAMAGVSAATASTETATAIGPDGTPGGGIQYCYSNVCNAPIPAMGDPLAMVGPTGSAACCGEIGSINSSDQGLSNDGADIYTLGSATEKTLNFYGYGSDLFDNGAVVGGEDGAPPYGTYIGIVSQASDGTVTSIPCADSGVSVPGGANEYGDIAIEDSDASNQYVWHSGVCYTLASVEPASLMGWTFPSEAQPVINGLGQIATVGDPPGSSTPTAVFFTPQYPTPTAYRLTGTVTTGSGTPVAGVPVQVYRAGGSQVTPVVSTASDGTYTYTLNSAPYSVTVGPGDSVGAGSACVTTSASSCTVYMTANRIVNFTGTVTGSPGSGKSGGPGGSSASGTPSIGATRVTGTTAAVPVSCSHVGACTVTLTMSVTETTVKGKVVAVGASETLHAKKVKKVKKTVVVGKIKVTLAAGQKKTVKLALNAAGKRLLSTRHTLEVKLTTITPKTTISTTRLKFTAKTKSHKHKHKR
jgi:hypothetical protein